MHQRGQRVGAVDRLAIDGGNDRGGRQPRLSRRRIGVDIGHEDPRHVTARQPVLFANEGGQRHGAHAQFWSPGAQDQTVIHRRRGRGAGSAAGLGLRGTGSRHILGLFAELRQPAIFGRGRRSRRTSRSRVLPSRINAELNHHAGRPALQLTGHVLDFRDRLSIDCRDQVADFHATLGRRPAGHRFGHADSLAVFAPVVRQDSQIAGRVAGGLLVIGGGIAGAGRGLLSQLLLHAIQSRLSPGHPGQRERQAGQDDGDNERSIHGRMAPRRESKGTSGGTGCIILVFPARRVEGSVARSAM